MNITLHNYTARARSYTILATWPEMQGAEMIGNEIERVVSWKGKKDVGLLAGRPIRLLFELKDADLFAIRFE